MILHRDLTKAELISLFRKKLIVVAGNQRLKIYGTLHCGSGKRMKKSNRVFFGTVEEALKKGFRPCGCCLKSEHAGWKSAKIRLGNCACSRTLNQF